MSKIIFFSIPAHGHTNPTIPLVTELVNRGHQVWYYSFLEFQAKIEGAGARFIACDEYLPKLSQEELERKAGKDFAALIEMIVDTTIALDEKVCKELRDIQPDCIVSDSLCFWGKLFAQKLQIPYICSTTTFAFNKYTAKMMKRSLGEIWKMFVGMPKINKKIQLLKDYQYQVENFVSIIQNDNETDTIVYTSKEFQPLAGTFSDRFSFVGPSIKTFPSKQNDKKDRKLIYISLGTVLNQNFPFYQNCVEAFANTDYDVLMSVGEKTVISVLGSLPRNFTVKNSVDQISTLQTADIFITHCGMNSVSESLYFGVPMVLFPQHSEQRIIADRVAELGAGVKLKGRKSKHLAAAVVRILENQTFRENAQKLSETFRNAGGAKRAADVILTKMEKRSL
ncbi:macrolide family glycosyltransferase [Lederbergia galactosidilytica]|uniref:Glucosyltransferase n=1 Tax=Lederbergia galactosidilytica TaxID=217031 RepID=A0A178A6V6_9BACI|nr:macrolide family glycosyltransferase [Lederbergia galactosidilytica]KRG14705.1 glucosyltransferase [Virgibacillus soli]MBP1917140.1 MGT family glycosyltransferase [Lederbergia galactosidilytica]OAK74828.1 glucosyltransferase [Lederbergia galactosidilytica]